MRENTDIFKCPICHNQVDMVDLKSLICNQDHCFDLAKSGYVNFLLNPIKTEYDKTMFQSRNIICKHGFFEPMLDAVSEIIKEHTDNTANSTDTIDRKSLILDIGCGEGSHLNRIVENLHRGTRADFVGVGMDISKDGILIASKEYKNCIWCVGDLARSPLRDHKFDVILSILSPTNYEEFKRLLSGRGLLIKVVPGENYLKELREAFYKDTDKQNYSNHKVVQHFYDNFDTVEERKINYEISLDREMLTHLIRMTPLSWAATDDDVERAIPMIGNIITVDFTILSAVSHHG
ncbi:MAG: methyltransferase domain-containing protein [Clostridiales bacterium]|nr:methyltransferase domain-containing protein [Clostridiales bacterium]